MRTAVLAAYLANEQIRRRAAALAAEPSPEPEEPEEPEAPEEPEEPGA